MDNKIKILAIGGSLRKDSYSQMVLDSLLDFGSENVEIEAVNNLAEIPVFNQDLENDLPESVKDFKAKIKAADAIIFVTPEYNYSIPGYLKNAMDWASRPNMDNSFNDKPAAIISVSNGMLGGARVQYVLRQVGVSLNLHFLNRPEAMVSSVMDKVKDGKLSDEHTIEKIKKILEALVVWTKRISK